MEKSEKTTANLKSQRCLRCLLRDWGVCPFGVTEESPKMSDRGETIYGFSISQMEEYNKLH